MKHLQLLVLTVLFNIPCVYSQLCLDPSTDDITICEVIHDSTITTLDVIMEATVVQVFPASSSMSLQKVTDLMGGSAPNFLLVYDNSSHFECVDDESVSVSNFEVGDTLISYFIDMTQEGGFTPGIRHYYIPNTYSVNAYSIFNNGYYDSAAIGGDDFSRSTVLLDLQNNNCEGSVISSVDKDISYQQQISLISNPVSHELNLSEKADFWIYDVHGKLMVSGCKATIRVNELTSGLYILRIEQQNGTLSSTRFIKD